jgi:hypothetical protein
MDYEIVKKEEVLRKLRLFGIRNGDEVVVRMYLTRRDPQFETELYHCLNECFDELGLVDVLLMAERRKISVDETRVNEFDFDFRFQRRYEEGDISYKD